MKTLDEIIKRDDYKKITVPLKDRVEELAEVIRNKMCDLDISRLGGVKVCVYETHIGTYRFLADVETDRSYEDVGREYLYGGDFTCRVIGVSNKKALAFLNSVRSYIDMLDCKETQKVKAIQEALDNTEDLIKEVDDER